MMPLKRLNFLNHKGNRSPQVKLSVKIFRTPIFDKKGHNVGDAPLSWVSVYVARLFLKRGMLCVTHKKFYKAILSLIQTLALSIQLKNIKIVESGALEQSLLFFPSQTPYSVAQYTSLNELIPLSDAYTSTQRPWSSFVQVFLFG